MSERYICIHGHFYQPPRENPWLEEIERQDSAYPYHDWNERIAAECYAPNAASRILDDRGRIVRIVNNYSRISFNFGPTLLAWMEEHAPETYGAILEADRRSAAHNDGHGSALAQAYGHMIMPLADPLDRRTQVAWGIRDFRRRFQRAPEGMWLPETAVDVDTLEALAEGGIDFTILAPHQAAAVRAEGEEEWTDLDGGEVDTTVPYRVPLPSGRSIAVFFYDGPISRAVAFEGLLRSGERFAGRLTGATERIDDGPGLVHIATDGETYGHHHVHGEMALAYALRKVEEGGRAELCNYARYLERHPPRHEARIVEDTSWSCTHGVERWRSDCGCSTGGHPEWSQRWRGPLRAALDYLRDALRPLYEKAAGEFFDDPWAARDGYIDVVLDRRPETVERFFGEHARRTPEGGDRVRALELLELQRHAMLMYTSCGWFFDDLGGIETVQVLRYAGRAVQLARDLFGDGLEEEFVERLGRARSNVPTRGSGREIYRTSVEPAKVDLPKVAAHYAVSSVFEEYDEDADVYCYRVESVEAARSEAGRASLVRGRARVTSRVTLETGMLSYAVLHIGDHNVVGGVRGYRGDDAFAGLEDELEEHFARTDFPALIRVLDEYFRASTYSLRSLFRDEQRRILDRIIESSVADAEAAYSDVYEDAAPLMRFVADLGIPLPRPFRMAGEYVINTSLRRALEEPRPDPGRIRDLVDEAARGSVELDDVEVGFAGQRALERLVAALRRSPDDVELLGLLETTGDLLIRDASVDVNVWSVQNEFYRLVREEYPEVVAEADRGNARAREWVDRFRAVGELLSVAIPEEE